MTLVIHTPVAALNSSLFFPSSDNNSSSSSRRRPATAAAPPPLDDQPLSRSTQLHQRSAWTVPPPLSPILHPATVVADPPPTVVTNQLLADCAAAPSPTVIDDQLPLFSCPRCHRRSCSSLRASWLRCSCRHQPRHGAGHAAGCSAADSDRRAAPGCAHGGSEESPLPLIYLHQASGHHPHTDLLVVR